jgi:glycosyltransferase involved in cell wall biosynthesis
VRALIFSHSNIRRDPRILRQVNWLREYGFSEIVTVGCGPGIEEAYRHYKISILKPLKRYVGYMIRNPKKRFDYFYGNQLAVVSVSEIDSADLLVVNEVEYIPWILQVSREIDLPPIYIDLHEDHVSTAYKGVLEMLAFKSYWKWQNSHLKHFVNRLKEKEARFIVSTVEEKIAQLYASLLQTNVEIILNAPAPNLLRPSTVDPNQIKLVHHGFGTRGRGIETAIFALRKLDKRFTLDLILFTTPFFRIKLLALRYLLGLRSRVRISPALPLEQLIPELNKFDLALIILSGRIPGHLNALPNKFFESLHAKLAIVSGPNPTMSKWISDGGFGVVTPDWSTKGLTQSLEKLTTMQIEGMKKNSVEASAKYSSLRSHSDFMSILKRLLS